MLERRLSSPAVGTHVGAAAGCANFAVTADDDVGAQGAASAVGGILLCADILAILVSDLGAGNSCRGQDGAEDGGRLHAVVKSDHCIFFWAFSCSVWFWLFLERLLRLEASAGYCRKRMNTHGGDNVGWSEIKRCWMSGRTLHFIFSQGLELASSYACQGKGFSAATGKLSC